MVKFYSFSSSDSIKFESDIIEYKKNFFSFIDKSIENTIISIEINNNEILFKRDGDTSMSIIYKENTKTIGSYKNNMGLIFNFSVYTKRLSITNNKIIIEYDFYLDNILEDEFKIYILID